MIGRRRHEAAMALPEPKLDAAGVNALLRRAFPKRNREAVWIW